MSQLRNQLDQDAIRLRKAADRAMDTLRLMWEAK